MKAMFMRTLKFFTMGMAFEAMMVYGVWNRLSL